MRSEQEMMDLILNAAKKDERIRSVIMNGSRTNPNAPHDCFQDYDIVYVVRDVSSFTSDHRQIDIFGERIIMQMPDTSSLFPHSDKGSFAYLMLFKDGNRIDLTLFPIEKIDDLIGRDSLSRILLDKDGIIAPFPPSNDGDYRIQPPTDKQFADCCNEFWWVSTYIAKGLWRDEIPYAKAMLEEPVRDMLIKKIEWHVGVTTNFSVSAGKCGKYLKNYLEKDLWLELIRTYPNADPENIWQSLFTMCNLFRKIAVGVASHFGYTYPYSDDKAVSSYLKHVRDLPCDATQIY
ncbi:aminoglycoside 6-adenylyltransferase [Bacillaceae bacterium Marseille-Q3522]|nr:aminoglycoside 6-adenylyltransferase [Bacillaceae bacterium Marseille-Q3522]